MEDGAALSQDVAEAAAAREVEAEADSSRRALTVLGEAKQVVKAGPGALAAPQQTAQAAQAPGDGDGDSGGQLVLALGLQSSDLHPALQTGDGKRE